jgi:N-acetylglutamate synthase
VPDLSRDHLGLRVSVRRRDPGIPGPRSLRDTVGVLEHIDADTLQIRRRDDELVTVARAEVVAARVVRDGPAALRRATDVDAATLQRVSTAGWPALETEPLGGWLLRAAGGFTGRANSVLPLGPPGLPFDAALAHVVVWYQDRGIVPRFQVPLPLAVDVDLQLAERGWTAYDPVRVLVADVAAVRLAAHRAEGAPSPTVSDRPDDAWLAAYHYRDEPLPPIASEVLSGGREPVFVSLSDDEGVLAVARGAVDDGWLGVTAVEVVPRARRRGLGTTLMRDLLDVGEARGARFTYLQVTEENAAARAFYDRLGYLDHHGYHYRRPAR